MEDTVELDLDLWIVPGGKMMVASVYEDYIGLDGQRRLGLVDRLGRVHHFDADQVHKTLWCDTCARDLP